MLATKVALSVVGRKERMIEAFVLEDHLSAQFFNVTRCSSRRRLVTGVGRESVSDPGPRAPCFASVSANSFPL